MQIELIETFLDLAETRSFNRTADRLGLTQSTVSARVAALEKRVGRKLFTRSRAGTALTTAGLAFEPHARGLRHAWAEALRASQHTGNTALSMRIGLQTDLSGPRIGDWLTGFRKLLPETAFYLELDYSNQMCADLVAGQLNLGVMYSPRTWPDLHFESVGEVRYRLVSSGETRRAGIRADSYIRGNFSAIFEQQHNRLFPDLADVPLACGQSAAIVELLTSLGGAAYVTEHEAARLVGTGTARLVEDAPAIPQTVYAAIHARHRHGHVYRRLVSIIRGNLAN